LFLWLQIIPHAFGFRRPPVLNTLQAINAKVDMCNVLSDIEIAQGMLAKREESEQEQQEQVRLCSMGLQVLAAPMRQPVGPHTISGQPCTSGASLVDLVPELQPK
jgi:Poly(ADP-ribose) polymerase, regulatory domain